ncbi:hypothetical protein AOLI_G00049850 [Acnodon oligacanthus]
MVAAFAVPPASQPELDNSSEEEEEGILCVQYFAEGMREYVKNKRKQLSCAPLALRSAPPQLSLSTADMSGHYPG